MKIFKLINIAEAGIIYYCNAGKDRTGVVTALIQMLFNVEEKDIIADYLLSSVYLDDFLQEYIRKSNCENLKEIIIPKQEFMQKFIE